MKLARILVWPLSLLLLGTGCSLLQPPPTPSIPTPDPVSTALPLELQLARDSNPILDPVNNLVPAIDPDIAFLVEEVSKQNLTGYVQTLENFGTRNTFSATDQEGFGIGAARRWIFNEFVRVGGGKLDVQFQEYSFTFQGLDTTQQNIVATLPGKGNHPGVLVLMANYDTRGAGGWLDGEGLAPGADDNASGVAALLEIARLMSARTWNRTIIFVALTAEEQGTFGSRHFVKNAWFNDMVIDAAINNDMIGGRAGIPQSVRLFSIGPDTSNARQLARYIDYVGGLYLPTFPIQMIDGLDRDERWGDQREFVNAGYATVRLIESEEDISIQNSRRDTWSLIDYDYFRKIVQLNLVTLANMACAPPSPVPLITPMSEPGSFLVTWLTDPEADGYAISVRPLGMERFPPFRFVSSAQAGNVILSGFDPQNSYGISIAALNDHGCLGGFSSPEIIYESPS